MSQLEGDYAKLGSDALSSAEVVTALGFTPIPITSVPYDLACQVDGAPANSAVVMRFKSPRAFTLAASGQQGVAQVAATAQADFIVAVGGVTKATLRFAAAGTVPSVVSGTVTTIAAGNIITITAPASADATLADIVFTLPGTCL